MATVDHVHPTVPPARASGAAATLTAIVLAASVAAAGAALLALAGAVLPVAWAAPAMASSRSPGMAASVPAARHVVLIGVPGLLWTDMTAARMPSLWRLARQGSAGSLSVTGVHPLTCPADGWLTLNAGNRAAWPAAARGSLPAAARGHARRPGRWPGRRVFGPDRADALHRLRQCPAQREPVLGAAPRRRGPAGVRHRGRPGAGLALASPAGRVTSYLAGTAGLTRAVLARCPLTVIDLGPLPAGGAPRRAAVAADDREIGRVSTALPAGTRLVVTAPADGAVPHLHPIVITGPGYRSGLLTSPLTRQPGLAVLTDLTPTIAGWLGRPVPGTAVGARLGRTGRPGLAAAITGLASQDTAAQVYRATMPWFFIMFGLAGGLLFGLIAILGRAGPGGRPPPRPRIAGTAGVFLGSVPAGSFLASLAPWPEAPHPALLLYGLSVAWAAVIAAAACVGPWRRDPLGPPGFVGAVTLAVIAIDVMTGSHLQLGTPFGLSALVAGRFYGIGNNAVLVYAASGLLLCGWAGSAALRRGSRRLAVAGISAVAVVAVTAAGWPGFGAKVGGTIAMLPGFLLLIAVAAGARVTAWRGLLMVASGAAAATALAVAAYLLPGHSDIGAFTGQVLHGGAAAIVHRKVRANVGSLTVSPGSLVIPVVVAAAGAVIGWPGRFRARRLVRGYADLPLLRPLLAAIWLVGLLGWLTEDSGVTVPAAGLPLILPLLVAILAAVPATPATRGAGQPGAAARARPPAGAGPAQPAGRGRGDGRPRLVGHRRTRLSLSSHRGSSQEYVGAIPVVQDRGRPAAARAVATQDHGAGAYPARRGRHPGVQPPVRR